MDSVFKLLLLPLKVALCCFKVLSEEFVGEAEKRLVLDIIVRLCQYRDMQLSARGEREGLTRRRWFSAFSLVVDIDMMGGFSRRELILSLLE